MLSPDWLVKPLCRKHAHCSFCAYKSAAITRKRIHLVTSCMQRCLGFGQCFARRAATLCWTAAAGHLSTAQHSFDSSQDRLGDFEPVDFFMDGTCHFQTITGQALIFRREHTRSTVRTLVGMAGHNGGGKSTSSPQRALSGFNFERVPEYAGAWPCHTRSLGSRASDSLSWASGLSVSATLGSRFSRGRDVNVRICANE